MENQFVPYELAVKLKELGFKEKCIAFYNGKDLDWLIDDNNGLSYPTISPNMDVGLCVKAPLWQQAFDWLFNNFSYICIIENNMSYEQKQEKLKEAIRYIQDNKPK